MILASWWQDRSGAVIPARAIALILSLSPALWLLWQAVTSSLGPRPFTAAIHQSGDWAIRLLWVSLAITPLQRLFHAPKLIGARQIFGLASAAYAALHIVLYVADQKFALGRVASEIIQRFYLGIGSMALIGLLILTVNSGQAAIRRLGGSEWRGLHRMVYVIAPLALFHFYIQSKLDVTQPVLMTGALLWMFGFRLLPAHQRTEPLALIGLAVASALGTQLLELAWYGLATRIPASSIAEGIFDFQYEIRPMWTVLAATLPLAILPLLSDKPARRAVPQGVQGR